MRKAAFQVPIDLIFFFFAIFRDLNRTYPVHHKALSSFFCTSLFCMIALEDFSFDGKHMATFHVIKQEKHGI